tara:strand:+ start:826 stop:1476 length:651 start_codon:yes stop_codon:yes gene_type:complete
MVNEELKTDEETVALTAEQIAVNEAKKVAAKIVSQRKTTQNHYNTAVDAQRVQLEYVAGLVEGEQPSRQLQAIGWFCADVINATQLIDVDGNLTFDANANNDNYDNHQNQYASLKPAIENAVADYPNFAGLIRTRNASVELTEAQEAIQTSNAALALKCAKAMAKVVPLAQLAQPRFKKGTKTGVPHDEASMQDLIQGLIEKMTPLVAIQAEAQKV